MIITSSMPVKTKILPEGSTKAFFIGSSTTVTVQSWKIKILSASDMSRIGIRGGGGEPNPDEAFGERLGDRVLCLPCARQCYQP